MVIIGLTGSVAMGKSTAARAFRRLGVPVHDADAAVRRLLGPGGGAIAAVAEAFPGVVRAGAARAEIARAAPARAEIDRAELARRVFADPAALRRLEKILHPLVRRRTRAFLAACARRREPLVVLDVPLLFETGGEKGCDLVVAVSAPAFLQARRFLRRADMTADRLAATLARQTPDAAKRAMADIVVRTGLDRGFSFRAVRSIVAAAREPKQGARRGAWGPNWNGTHA